MLLITRFVRGLIGADPELLIGRDQSVRERRERRRLMQSPEGRSMLQRIRGVYQEMPGLELTASQAQRFWDLDRPTCETLLSGLAASKFLRLRRNGSFVLNNAL